MLRIGTEGDSTRAESKASIRRLMNSGIMIHISQAHLTESIGANEVSECPEGTNRDLIEAVEKMRILGRTEVR